MTIYTAADYERVAKIFDAQDDDPECERIAAMLSQSAARERALVALVRDWRTNPKRRPLDKTQAQAMRSATYICCADELSAVLKLEGK